MMATIFIDEFICFLQLTDYLSVCLFARDKSEQGPPFRTFVCQASTWGHTKPAISQLIQD